MTKSTETTHGLIVGISCGHGGPRHSRNCAAGGACQACGTTAGVPFGLGTEGEYTRRLGEQLLSLAKQSEMFDVVELNSPAETVSPAVRASRAKQASCEFVLSLHVNESDSTDTHGGHMLFWPGDPTGAVVSRVIAEAWPQGLRRQLLPSRMADGRYIAGMVEPAARKYWPRANTLLSAFEPLPTVLVEAFYASNKHDVRLALDPWIQLAMAVAMMRGLTSAGRRLRCESP
jgi:N-acetylmuramoyl-L-alanine amidase